MEDFNNLYNELIKSDRNNEPVFKSRLKLKFKDFINIKNTNPLSQLVNTYYNNKISSLTSLPRPNKEPIINAKPIDSDEKDKIINRLKTKNTHLHNGLSALQHKYDTLNMDSEKNIKHLVTQRKKLLDENKYLELLLAKSDNPDYDLDSD